MNSQYSFQNIDVRKAAVQRKDDIDSLAAFKGLVSREMCIN
jgi:hypothetical protein